MKRLLSALTVALLAVTTTGCAIHHDIQQDYPQYLRNNQGNSSLPKANAPATYSLTPQTETHHYEFRSVLVGYGNVWMVDFGKMLDQTLQSADVQTAFGKLEKQAPNSGGDAIVFDLREYSFTDFGAHITLAISVARDGKTILSKTYISNGKTQGGKMVFGGVFAMRNGVQQSTKLGLDDILERFITDLNAAGVAAQAPTPPATPPTGG